MRTNWKNFVKFFTVIFVSFIFSTISNAKMKIDMPMAYAASNFHSENGVFFC